MFQSRRRSGVERARSVERARRGGRLARAVSEALEGRVLLSTYQVTGLADVASSASNYDGTLRWAIQQANAHSGADTISFATGLHGTIDLTHGPLNLTAGNTTIDGPGVSSLTISGNGSGSVFIVHSGITATISGMTLTDALNGAIQNNKGTVTLTNMTLTNSSGLTGGGLFSSGKTTVTNCTFSNDSGNVDSKPGYGGGIFNSGTLTVANSTFPDDSASNNSSPSQGGGGLYNASGGIATVTNSNLSGDSATHGGAIDNYGSLTVNGCSLDNDQAAGFGGGAILNAANATITKTTLSGNQAGNGGAIQDFGGTTTISDCTLTANSVGTNDGGGIFNTGGITTVIDSTLSGNFAGAGAGIFDYSGGTVIVTNCTLFGNSATGSDEINSPVGGGAIFNGGGYVTITNSTIAGNSATSGGGSPFFGGGGIAVNTGAPTPVLNNTIVAGNTAANGVDDIAGPVSGDYNLIGNGTGMTGISNDSDGNQVGIASSPINPLLGPPALNGGPTKTMALLAGSPAVNGGSNALIPSGVTTDQRGFVRIFNGTVDIGAYEFNAAPPGTVLTVPMSPAIDYVTLAVDPAKPTDLEILSGGKVYKDVPFDTFSSVDVTGAASANNRLFINYNTGGFFSDPVVFNGAGTQNSLSVIDDDSGGTRSWSLGAASLTAVTGSADNPTVSFNAVQTVSLTGRTSGGEIFLVQNTAHSGIKLPTSTTVNISTLDTVNIQGTASPLTIDGTGSATSIGEGVAVGSLAPSLGGTLANVMASVTVNNVSALIADDSGDPAGRNATISAKSITGLGLPASVAINYAGLGELDVHGGAGGNTDTVTGTSAPTTLYPGTSDPSTVNVKATTAALTINGNDKVDYITVGSLAPNLGGTLTTIAGAITVTNTSAYTTLSLDDSGDTAGRTGTISPTSVTGFGLGGGAAVNFTGSQLTSLTVRGGAGANTDAVTGTTAPTILYPGASAASTVNVQATTSALTINGNNHTDDITISSDLETLATIAGSVTVTNVGTKSTLTADDTEDLNNNVTVDGSISPTTVTGFGMQPSATVYYPDTLESLTVNGGVNVAAVTETVTGTSVPTTLYVGNAESGAADVNIQATTAPLTINGDNYPIGIAIGSLAPALGGTLANIAGNVTVTDANGATLSLDDSGDTTARAGTISATSVIGFGMGSKGAVTYTGTSLLSLAVRGGMEGNTETVAGTSVPTTLYPGGLAGSTVNVKATTAPLTINGNTFQDLVNVGSLVPSLGGTLSSIAGAITVTNTSDSSTLSLDDSGDTKSQDATLTATSITGLGMASGVAVDYTGSQLASLTLRGGKAGADLTEINPSIKPTLIDITVV